MARFNLEHLMNVTCTNWLPLKIFYLSQADTLTGSTERLSAMLKWNNFLLLASDVQDTQADTTVAHSSAYQCTQSSLSSAKSGYT